MLTLADSLRLGSFTVFRDASYRGGKRAYSDVFYVLPDAPRLARDAEGGPAFDFLWYRQPPGELPTVPGAGGLVTLTVELGISAAEREALTAAIRAALAPEPLPNLELRHIPFKSGEVSLSFAGESAEGGELGSVTGGSGPARLAGDQRATFTVELTRDGAALLWDALERGLNLLQARYDLVFEHCLHNVRLRVWCDAQRAYESLAARLSAGPLGSGEARDSLVAQRLAGYELVAEQALAPDHRAALERLGQATLESALASAFFRFDAGDAEGETSGLDWGGRRGRLRDYDPLLEAGLNLSYAESFPLEQHAVLSDLVRIGLTHGELGDRVRRIDLDGGFFRILEVKIHCPVDFANDLIKAVKARLAYHASGHWGTVDRSGEFLFREGATVATFRTDLAAPELRSFRYEVEVYYAGESVPLRLEYPPVEATVIVLDLEGLGVLKVTVELQDVPFDRIRAAVIDLEYPSRGLTHRFILDAERPSGTWHAVVREALQPYRYRVAWLTADERRIEGEWQSSERRRLALDAPAEFRQRARQVQVVAAGDFSALAQIVVDLRTEGDEAANPVQISLSRPGETYLWEPRLAEPDQLRYQARRTLVYRDGSVRELAWTEEDRPVLVIRDALRGAVQVVPRLLDLGASLRAVLLALEYRDDTAGLVEQTTFVLLERSEEPVWTFRLADPVRRGYRYRMTLVPAAGPRTVTPWQEAEAAILVLRPPQD